MSTKLSIIVVSLLLALLVNSCTKVTPTGGGATTQTSTIFGWVERSDDLSRVSNVIVFDTRGTAPSDTTKADGSFKLTYQLTDNYTGTLVANRVTFGSDTISFTLAPGANDTLSRMFILKADTNSQKTAASSGKVASIVLVAGGDVNSIAIRGTGFTESTPLTFEARDSLGVAVGGINKTTIFFSLLGGPGGGEYVYPPSALTDLSGRAVTRVTSGTKPGVLQVFAYAKPDTLNPNYIVTSSPVRLTISGGLPDAAHFSLSAQKVNIAGISQDNIRDNISVIVGDRNGNPVQVGTAVYFNTTGGIIQPSAITSSDGMASVSLISANPRPANGQAFVTATTIGDSGAIISRTKRILFTGPPVIIGPASNFQIVDSGSYSFSYKVSDANGNPLSSGTAISVTKDGPGSGDLDLKGDVSSTMIDTQDSTLTVFNVQVQDKSRGGASGLVKFSITVTGDNGTASYSWTGTQLKEGESPIGTSTGIAASIQLLGISANTVSVRGTGASETAVFSFQVKDSLGNPITAPNSVPLTFTIQNGPGGGEFLFPPTSTTDANGKASTTLSSGTKSGVVQIIASTVLSNGVVVKSSPVPMTIASGLADPAHAAMWTSAVNLPFSTLPGVSLGSVSVQLGDRYGNPAQPSAVYFTTNAGLITASATSSNTGLASATLISGPPTPAGGIDTITSITQGENGQNITQRIVVTASGAPIIRVPSVPSGVLPAIPAGAVQGIDVIVEDLNNNPLSAGNIISVGLLGDPAVTGQISLSLNNGSTSVTTIDTRDPSTVHYALKIAASQAGSVNGGSFILVINSTGPNGTASAQLNGTLLPKGVTTQPSPTAKLPAQIVPGSPSTSDLTVLGVGGTESSQLTFQVLDSTRAPLDKNNRTYATFSVNFYPNSIVSGGTPPHCLPDADSTDDQGIVRVSVVSGSEAGVVQVVARIQLAGGQTIVSQPVRISVHAGFADRAHYGITPSQYSFAGFNSSAIAFTVAVGDTFSNPVPAGTEVYFHSQAGRITTIGATNATGFVTNTLFPDYPTPDAAGTSLAGRPTFDATYGHGYEWVYAQTKGNYNSELIDSVLVLWCEGPITITGLPATIAIPTQGTSPVMNCTITDGNNNPLPNGTTISVSFKYPITVNSTLAYSADGSLSSSQAVTIANAPFARFAGPGITSFSFTVTDLSIGGTSPGTRISVIVSVTAPGIGFAQTSVIGLIF
jgi:hypothetical protein